jgi:hypothetical protein
MTNPFGSVMFFKDLVCWISALPSSKYVLTTNKLRDILHMLALFFYVCSFNKIN